MKNFYGEYSNKFIFVLFDDLEKPENLNYFEFITAEDIG